MPTTKTAKGQHGRLRQQPDPTKAKGRPFHFLNPPRYANFHQGVVNSIPALLLLNLPVLLARRHLPYSPSISDGVNLECLGDGSVKT
jgi:hypothetical protein